MLCGLFVRFRKSLILATVSFRPTVRPVIQARTPSTFAPNLSASSVFVIPLRMRTASTLCIRAANCFRSSSRRPGLRQRIQCLSAIPKRILTSEESVIKAENITCHNKVLRRSTCGCSRYWPDWVPGTLKGRAP